MKRSWMRPSRAPKRELRCWPHQARQGRQDRRYRLWRWSSSRRICRKRFACRVPACGSVLAGCFLDELPERLIGDKAHGSDALDTQMNEYGVAMLSPNRSNRKRKTQDGRALRRYRRRWKVERLFAWMQNYRRLVTRWEFHIDNFLSFIHLACPFLPIEHLCHRLWAVEILRLRTRIRSTEIPCDRPRLHHLQLLHLRKILHL